LTKAGAETLTLSEANTYSGLTEVRAGTLALSGGGAISDSLALHDGAAFSTGGAALSLFRLDVRGSAAYAGDLDTAGGSMNFYVPSAMSGGAIMLSVSGNADISGSTTNVGIDGASSTLESGDQLVLINAAALSGAPANTTSNGRGMQGVTLRYEFDLTTTGNQLLATVAGAPTVNPRTKALSVGNLAGLALISQGADLAAGQGMSEAVRTARLASRSTGRALGVFGSIGGGWSRYETGSHLNMKSLALISGLAWGADLAPGFLTLGAFFEYGNGSYDTYNSFSNAASVHGDGDVYHLGGGVLGRINFELGRTGSPADERTSDIYVEASFRAGGVHNEYDSSDLRDALGREAEYDSSSAWYGFHLGGGYVWSVTEAASLDLYGKYFWTRQKGDSVTLSSGDRVKFADADSSRLRLGWRFTQAVNEHFSPYIGAAWEHEFDGKARATAGGHSINTPSLSGDTGIGERGLTLKPSAALPLSFDLGLQGYAGRREGLTGSLRVKFEF
jgi:outer membrane autotransporter protein